MSIKLVFDDIFEMREFFQLCNFDIIETKDTNDIIPVKGNEYTLDDILFDPEELDEKEDVVPVKDIPKVDYNSTYSYDFDRHHFKTKKGRKSIWLTGGEALDIIDGYKKGLSASDLYYAMDFTSDSVKLHTVAHFLSQYRKGLMDYALRCICNNTQYNEDPADYLSCEVMM